MHKLNKIMRIHRKRLAEKYFWVSANKKDKEWSLRQRKLKMERDVLRMRGKNIKRNKKRKKSLGKLFASSVRTTRRNYRVRLHTEKEVHGPQYNIDATSLHRVTFKFGYSSISHSRFTSAAGCSSNSIEETYQLQQNFTKRMTHTRTDNAKGRGKGEARK